MDRPLEGIGEQKIGDSRYIADNVTKFVEISPIWKNFGSLGLFHEGFILYLANFGAYFGNFFGTWCRCKWPKFY